MDESWKFSELRSWSEIVSANVNLLMTANLTYLMAHPEIPVSRDLRQLMTLNCLDEATVGTHYHDIRQCAKAWDQLVAAADEQELKKQINSCEPARRWIWEGIRTVRSTSRIRLSRTFQLLMVAMKQFSQICQRKKFGTTLLCSILKVLPGHAVIIPFIIFNGTVAHDPDFMTPEEEAIWGQLEACIMIVLKDDPELLDKIEAKQQELVKQTAQQMRGVLRIEGM
jgi:hypothetical protein